MSCLNRLHSLSTHLCTVSVDPGRLPVVDPRIVKHEPHVVHVLPRIRVLARVQVVLDRAQVHRLFDNLKVVRDS